MLRSISTVHNTWKKYEGRGRGKGEGNDDDDDDYIDENGDDDNGDWVQVRRR